VKNEILTGFVAKQSQYCKAVLSVCTGSFILHAAGLLRGKKATTHWLYLDDLRSAGDVEVVEERFVVDGKVWTSSNRTIALVEVLSLSTSGRLATTTTSSVSSTSSSILKLILVVWTSVM